MHRFFIPPEWISKNHVSITGWTVHQLRDVLRLRRGDHIAILDNTGWEYETEITNITREQVTCEIFAKRMVEGPKTKINLYQALLKGNSFEIVLQKCTEIGVSCFVPFTCDRCMARIPSDYKLERWRKIISEAAEQSGRGTIPKLQPVSDFREACEGVTNFSLLAWEGENKSDLKSVLQSQASTKCPYSVNVFVGPEGGFSQSDVEFAQQHHIIPVTLGKRVLRAETTGLVTAAAILYEYGDLS